MSSCEIGLQGQPLDTVYMSSALPVRRRAIVCLLGSAATGTVSQTVVAQQADDTNETGPGNDTDNGAEATADDSGTTTNETDSDTDEQDAETEAFNPRLDLDCYALSVDAETYDSVELRFTDGTTVTFDDGYSGATLFGFSGDGRFDSDAETAITEFHGPIAWATVIAGEAAETVTNSGRCPFADLTFDCDSARFSRGNDVRMRFVDGSVKRWDPPVDPDQTRFGSPGRVIESVAEESAEIEITNPDPDCEPGGYATVFDCTEVTVGPEEFAAEPTFDRAMLTFVDGSTQPFTAPDSGSTFTAPETFAGTEDNTGTVIESVGIEKRDGDIAFRLVNPTVEDCEPASPADADEGATDGKGLAQRGPDRVEGGSAVDTEGGGKSRPSPTDTGSESTGGDESSGGSLPTVDESISGHLPWWSGIAAAGGAAGTVSYLVSRTLGETPNTAETGVDSTSDSSDGSDDAAVDTEAVDDAEAVDETANRWDRFGNG